MAALKQLDELHDFYKLSGVEARQKIQEELLIQVKKLADEDGGFRDALRCIANTKMSSDALAERDEDAMESMLSSPSTLKAMSPRSEIVDRVREHEDVPMLDLAQNGVSSQQIASADGEDNGTTLTEGARLQRIIGDCLDTPASAFPLSTPTARAVPRLRNVLAAFHDRCLCCNCYLVDPCVTSCNHIYSLQCLEQMTVEALEEGAEGLDCVKCGMLIPGGGWRQLEDGESPQDFIELSDEEEEAEDLDEDAPTQTLQPTSEVSRSSPQPPFSPSRTAFSPYSPQSPSFSPKSPSFSPRSPSLAGFSPRSPSFARFSPRSPKESPFPDLPSTATLQGSSSPLCRTSFTPSPPLPSSSSGPFADDEYPSSLSFDDLSSLVSVPPDEAQYQQPALVDGSPTSAPLSIRAMLVQEHEARLNDMSSGSDESDDSSSSSGSSQSSESSDSERSEESDESADSGGESDDSSDSDESMDSDDESENEDGEQGKDGEEDESGDESEQEGSESEGSSTGEDETMHMNADMEQMFEDYEEAIHDMEDAHQDVQKAQRDIEQAQRDVEQAQQDVQQANRDVAWAMYPMQMPMPQMGWNAQYMPHGVHHNMQHMNTARQQMNREMAQNMQQMNQRMAQGMQQMGQNMAAMNNGFFGWGRH